MSSQFEYQAPVGIPGTTLDQALSLGAGKGQNLVIFYETQVYMKGASEIRAEELGLNKEEAETLCPVYSTREMVKIITPGDRYLEVHHRASKEMQRRYPSEWMRWKQFKDNKIPGTPIEQWASLTDSQKASFRAMNIFTIEQFAKLDDSVMHRIMGGEELRKRAKAYVESQDKELVTKIRDEAAAKQKELEEKLAKMEAMLEKLTAPTTA